MLTYGEDYFQQKEARQRGRNNPDTQSGYDEYSVHDAPDEQAVQACIDAIQPTARAQILEIGSAYGYTVQKLRQRGYTCFGLDISTFVAPRDVSGFLTVGDARLTAYTTYNHVIGFNILSCFTDLELAPLIIALNRSRGKNFFQIDDALEVPENIIRREALSNYNLKTLADWSRMPWKVGTTLRAWRTGETVIK